MTQSQLRQIWEKTHGHCHFCGDLVEFEKRGWKDGDLNGYWEVDHVIQKGKGGSKSFENCLPACTRCNRLRWHRHGEEVRELLFLGLIGRDEIAKSTSVGLMLVQLREKRVAQNMRRRKSIAPISPEAHNEGTESCEELLAQR